MLFYRSTDERAVTTIGVVESYETLTDASEIVAKVKRRTVYSMADINLMAQKPTRVMLFRLVRHLAYFHYRKRGLSKHMCSTDHRKALQKLNMTNLKRFLPMEGSAALISIHPNYVERILSGEKCLEFRRSWAANPIDILVIYATAPVQQIVAVTQVGNVFRGSKNRLWELARDKGGGISRRKLFDYMQGKKRKVAL